MIASKMEVVDPGWNILKKMTTTSTPLLSFSQECVSTMKWTDGKTNNSWVVGNSPLPFGDYKVKLTVPKDHIVGATGVLQNPDKVLSATQMERWEQAPDSGCPCFDCHGGRGQKD